jgi:hypothetical protein
VVCGVVAQFDDMGGIVGHHCLYFHFTRIIIKKNADMKLHKLCILIDIKNLHHVRSKSNVQAMALETTSVM